MLRWAGLVGSMAALTIFAVSGCKERNRITVIQQAPPPPAVVVEPAPAPVVEMPPPPAPVVVEPAPAPVVVAPAPVVVEPVVTPAVSVGFFVEKLGHHGHWVSVATYGNVWVPSGVAVGWQPYTLGHWAYTDAYGWTWVSDEPWGWATYHYGRWVFAESQGWVWVPGTVWGPAWVVWRTGGGYVGWAPMPPEAIVAPVAVTTAEVNINININFEKRIRPQHWVFVEERHVLEPVHTHIVIAKHDWIINLTKPSTHLVEAHGRIINRSLVVRDVERASGRTVQPMRIREVDAAVSTDTRGAARSDEMVVPRARLRPIENTRTGTVAPSNPRVTTGARPAANTPAQPMSTSRTVQPRSQDVTPPQPSRPPMTRQPVTLPDNGAVRDRAGSSRTADVKPNTAVPAEVKSGALAPTDTARRPSSSAPTRKPVPTSPTPAASDHLSGATHTPAPVPGTVRQASPASDTPAAGAVRRADTNRQGTKVREGQPDVSQDRPTSRKSRDVQATPAPEQPAQPSAERISNVRRGAEATPTPAVSGDTNARKAASSDARRDRTRTTSDKPTTDRPNDREHKTDREQAND